MKREQTRRRVAQIGAIILALALAFGGVLSIAVVSASADERSDSVQQRDESKAKAAEVREELEGLDADLANLFIAMEETKAEVADAEIALADAEAELAAAQRYHEQILDELSVAEAEVAALDTEIGTSRTREGALTQAVGDMARDLYRGGKTSPLQVVMSAEGVGEISSRAASATSLSRVQSRALDDVRSGLVVKENQMDKQKALTQRVTELELEAQQALQQADVAKEAVANNLESLEVTLAGQQQAQSDWESRKQEAVAQLEQANAEVSRADAKIAEIDRENKAKQQVFTPPPPARPAAPSTPQAPSVSQGAAPASGALFARPFRFAAPITSPYGWRIHPILGYSVLHPGTDFGAGCGTSQYATRTGVVSKTAYDDISGNYVLINHGMINGSSFVTHHGHLSQILVSPGQQVNTSTVIGLTGTTGRSTGCHLHLGLYINGSWADIMPYM